MEEIWKDIDGYEGYYQISNFGRVKSLARFVFNKDGSLQRFKKETIKSPKLDKDGYLKVTLSVNGNNKTFPIHRLVANAFLQNGNSELEVNHIDLNRKNNRIDNLEWVTHVDNVRHSVSQGKYQCHSGSNNGRSKPMIVYNLDGSFVERFEYGHKCAEWMINNNYCKGKSPHGVLDSIRKCIKNNKQYYNFIIKYV